MAKQQSLPHDEALEKICDYILKNLDPDIDVIHDIAFRSLKKGCLEQPTAYALTKQGVEDMAVSFVNNYLSKNEKPHISDLTKASHEELLWALRDACYSRGNK